MATFHPNQQEKYCSDPKRCILGDAPTLSEYNAAYGQNAAAAWLVVQLFDLSEYSGSKQKLSRLQLASCARLIASKFHWLKLTELMLFFYRFKGGDYGEFKGSVDPMLITSSIPKFIPYRNEVITADESEKMKLKITEQRKNAITYEEYLRRKGTTIKRTENEENQA